MRLLIKKTCVLLLFSGMIFILSSCMSGAVKPSSVSGFKLNTFITITAYDANDYSVLEECLSLCDEYENLFSRTNENSILYQANERKITEIPGELAELIQWGIHYGKLSAGSFDITIGGISSLWDFTSENPVIPANSDIESRLSYVDYESIQLQKKNSAENTYLLTVPEGCRIDLGALAKGYIADKLKTYLIENGVKSAVIDLGGNILCVGNKPNGTDFTIGVKKPFSDSGEILVSLNIHDKSVVSSGIYERCFTKDNQLYHHILNPKTGYPFDNDLISVTIISDISINGDGLSTTCYTLGFEKGMELIENLENTEAIFVTKDNQIHYSSGMPQYLK